MPSDGAGLIRRIEIALGEPALPFKLYECRGYQSNENFRSARGILTDLDRNPGDLEAGFPQSVDLAIGKHRIMLRIFAFKPGGYSSHRTTKHGIIFLYNGQLHAAYPTRFFSRQSVRKAHIANDLLVTVDCSNLDRRDFEDLFMNSRDRLRSDSKLTTELVRKIEEFLVSNESLRELENQRRSEAIASKIDDDQSREQLLKQLLDDNPDLSRYLLEGGILEPVYNLFRIRTVKASTTICRLVLSFLSQFFQSRRHFSSQAKDRSTTHRFGSTTKVCSSLRFTTSTEAPNRPCTAVAKGFPV